MKTTQSVNIRIVSREGFTPREQVQDSYNLSVQNVLFSNLKLPNVPQNQRATPEELVLGARGLQFKALPTYLPRLHLNEPSGHDGSVDTGRARTIFRANSGSAPKLFQTSN